MMRFSSFLCVIIFTVASKLYAQQSFNALIVGEKDHKPVQEALILLMPENKIFTSDSAGFFTVSAQNLNGKYIRISHPDIIAGQYAIDSLWQQGREDVIQIKVAYVADLSEVTVLIDQTRKEASIIKLDPKVLSHVPSPFQDISSILATMPGVSSNNELSNQYSVRGGNFDENLVYVNDIPVHRPFVLRAGQQEGLSFINPDMTESIVFSAGGWQPKYGDALSSVMNITYKKPKEFSTTVNAGLLGGSVHAAIPMKNNNGLSIGVRHKDSRYLLRTLEVQGEYFPRFTDVQAYYAHTLDEAGDTELEVIVGYSNNNFRVNPVSRETDFGAFPSTFRLFVAFDGTESLQYDVLQGGLSLRRKFNDRLTGKWMASAFYTGEREYSEIENAYRLCALGRDNDDDENPCRINLGAGRHYEYRRNQLAAYSTHLENRYSYVLSKQQEIEFGIGMTLQSVNDLLNEYSFTDSVDFVSIDHVLQADNDLFAAQIFTYFQHQLSFSRKDQLTYGARINYWTFNGQLLFSPRVQYAYRPEWKRDVMFRFATGLYQQPAFYREIRDFEGTLNENLKAQSAAHLVAGIDQRLTLWGRRFTMVTELWGKYLYNVIPYDIDNVRIRYYANNDAEAYALGADFRIGGEFIPGSDSWFSLGVLNTRERLAEDGRGWQRRPSDQRLRLGIFFQDHFPNDPTTRAYLNVQVGTGLPFGPPNNELLRNSFVSPAYRRVDIGLSKELKMNKLSIDYLQSLWISAEILNLLGSDNPISFNWVQTIDNANWAVPNALSARFLNARMIAKF